MSLNKNYQKGLLGEYFAEKFLISLDFCILLRRFRCQQAELDLIARKQDMLCFVEVKYRNTLNYGLPFEAVSSAKVKKLTYAGEAFLAKYPQYQKNIRIFYKIIAIYPQHESLWLDYMDLNIY